MLTLARHFVDMGEIFDDLVAGLAVRVGFFDVFEFEFEVVQTEAALL